MSSEWSDPLYRPRTDLPDTGERVRFAGHDVVVTTTDTDPASVAASWLADREIVLIVRADLPAADLGAVLAGFAEYAVARPAGYTLARVGLASRDVDRALVTRRAGFAPQTHLMIRDHARAPAARPAPAGVTVRAAAPADAPVIARLWWEQTEYERRLGSLRAEPAMRAGLEAHIATQLATGGVTFLGEQDGAPVSLAVGQSVAQSEWAGARVAGGPVAFLSIGSTTATARGGGVGTATVAALHEWQRAQGARYSLLTVSAYNPLSIPFWAQQGYRPLTTTFGRDVS